MPALFVIDNSIVMAWYFDEEDDYAGHRPDGSSPEMRRVVV